jgi:hypothetical protein
LGFFLLQSMCCCMMQLQVKLVSTLVGFLVENPPEKLESSFIEVNGKMDCGFYTPNCFFAHFM